MTSEKSPRTTKIQLLATAIIVIVAVIVLVARGLSNRESHDFMMNLGESDNGYNGYIIDAQNSDVPTLDEQEQIPISLRLTREDFLYDFDYLMTMMQENFPYFGLIYRRNGVDMTALMPELRAMIEDESFNLNFVSFYDLLRTDFFYHAWPVTHLWFTVYDELYEWGMLETADNINGMMRYRDLLRLPPQSYRGPIISSDIETTIIEEGRIAYISMQTLPRWPGHELTQRIDEFYSQIEDFEHLIIDLRGNRGGFTSFFDDLIASPLINYTLQATFYHFYKDGEHNRQHMRNIPIPFSADMLYRIFPDINIPQAVIDDLSVMDFFVRETLRVAPRITRQIDFNGKIWMLTDGYMFSSAHMVAAFYKEVGFATLVGETTAGMHIHNTFGSNFVQLPRTGLFVRYDFTYVLDSNGRPVDYGIDPHYFNLPGMDALETVLELIRRGN